MAKKTDKANTKEQPKCQSAIYVYNTCIPPKMGRCGNVRSEKLMLTALRGRGARNTQK
jgi:hypothetical protein